MKMNKRLSVIATALILIVTGCDKASMSSVSPISGSSDETTSATQIDPIATVLTPATTETPDDVDINPGEGMRAPFLYVEDMRCSPQTFDFQFLIQKTNTGISFIYDEPESVKQFIINCLSEENHIGYAEYDDEELDFIFVEHETLRAVYRIDDNAFVITSPYYYDPYNPILYDYEENTLFCVTCYINSQLYEQKNELYPYIAV